MARRLRASNGIGAVRVASLVPGSGPGASYSKQRYRGRACRLGRGRTFLLAYAYAGLSPTVKQQIVDMAMNASGIRDTARVGHVSPNTVLKELKKGT
jgi:transposase-like protein